MTTGQTTRERISRYSVDELLDTLSLSIMVDNIQSQIEDVNATRRNFIDIVKGKFNIINEGDFDSETMNQIRDEINTFYNSIIRQIVDKFGLMYNSSDDIAEVAEDMYTFFVVQRKSNTEKFLETYITEHMDDIVESLDLRKATDVMTTTFVQRATGNIDPAIVAANINKVIEYVLSLDVSSEEFLDVLSGEGDYYVAKMQEYQDSSEIDGNYPTIYMEEVLDEYDSDYASQLRNNLRCKFVFGGMI